MSFNREHWTSAEHVFAMFDADKNKGLDFVEFKALCIELFGDGEIRDAEYRISEIFRVFDGDGDGLLKGDEWKRCYVEWISVALNPICALVVVDVQNDFIDGSLALKNCVSGEDGAEVVEPINRLVMEKCWKKIVYSLDWHPDNHIGFYENLHTRRLHPDSKITIEKAKPFDTVRFMEPDLEQCLWPRHCVMNTRGAQLHNDLIVAPGSDQVRKGQNPDMDAYSAFFDNAARHCTELLGILKDNGITDVFVCGLALDICVKATCLDGLGLGYRLAVVEDLCRGVDPDEIDHARKAISAKGGLVTNGSDAIALASGEKRSLVMAHHAALTLAKKWSTGDVQAAGNSVIKN